MGIISANALTDFTWSASESGQDGALPDTSDGATLDSPPAAPITTAASAMTQRDGPTSDATPRAVLT